MVIICLSWPVKTSQVKSQLKCQLEQTHKIKKQLTKPRGASKVIIIEELTDIPAKMTSFYLLNCTVCGAATLGAAGRLPPPPPPVRGSQTSNSRASLEIHLVSCNSEGIAMMASDIRSYIDGRITQIIRKGLFVIDRGKFKEDTGVEINLSYCKIITAFFH